MTPVTSPIHPPPIPRCLPIGSERRTSNPALLPIHARASVDPAFDLPFSGSNRALPHFGSLRLDIPRNEDPHNVTPRLSSASLSTSDSSKFALPTPPRYTGYQPAPSDDDRATPRRMPFQAGVGEWDSQLNMPYAEVEGGREIQGIADLLHELDRACRKVHLVRTVLLKLAAVYDVYWRASSVIISSRNNIYVWSSRILFAYVLLLQTPSFVDNCTVSCSFERRAHIFCFHATISPFANICNCFNLLKHPNFLHTRY